MTAGGDFIPVDDFEIEEPSYPVLFGLRLTPTVSGTLIALLGSAVAVWLLLNPVRQAWQTNQQIQAEIATKREQLRDQAEIQAQIDQAQEDLAEAEDLRADVLALFADEESLDTLLIDVNARVLGADGLAGTDARLERFELVPGTETTPGQDPEIITDGSFGAALNNRLKQRIYSVEIEGSFGQTQSIIRNIERLRPLLVIKDLETRPEAPSAVLVAPDGTISQTLASLTTTFQLIALYPVELEEVPPPAPAPVDPNAPPADPNAPPADPNAAPAEGEEPAQ
ncbi:hypothetical protein [Vacuolonema iberomarrocanum]|uniref:hypothetical protein n=1 Tax=Vacuolonema iberomarrocanum TaxID=3454632 RepID=UPI0019E6E433|nr:hypothetical protein [filamentous cyanobacterium LEGE 07170]